MSRRVKIAGSLFTGQVPDGAVYIGRGAPHLRRSPYANPYATKQYGRDSSLRLYQQWLDDNPGLVAAARRELDGRDVACWCQSTDLCHGDLLLAAMADVLVIHRRVLRAAGTPGAIIRNEKGTWTRGANTATRVTPQTLQLIAWGLAYVDDHDYIRRTLAGDWYIKGYDKARDGDLSTRTGGGP